MAQRKAFSTLPSDVETDEVDYVDNHCSPSHQPRLKERCMGTFESAQFDSGLGSDSFASTELSIHQAKPRVEAPHSITDTATCTSRTLTSSNVHADNKLEHQVHISQATNVDEGFDSIHEQTNSVRNSPPLSGHGSDAISDDVTYCPYDQNEDGDSDLHLSVIEGGEEVITVLRLAEDPEDVDIWNLLRQTALHLAVLTNQPSNVRWLVVAGACVEMRDIHGNTPLHLATQRGLLRCAEALLKPVETKEVEDLKMAFDVLPQRLPQQPELRNYEGFTCLHLAVAGGHREMVSLLTGPRFKADVNAKDGKSGRAVVHHVVEAGDLDMLKFLLDTCKDIDLDARTYDCNTPLSLARGRRLQSIIDLLVQSGAAESDIEEDYDSDSDVDMDEVVEGFDDMDLGNCKR